MMWLEIQAPFAAFRPFVAGGYRPTAGFLTHSAVYGLLLNLAGVETRICEHDVNHKGKEPTTLNTHPEQFRLALGIPEGFAPPKAQALYQQLHVYLQDNSPNPISGLRAQEEGFLRCKGVKSHVAPLRREVLIDIRAVAVVEADDRLLEDIRRGLGGGSRYGLPFLGDNNLLPDRVGETTPQRTRWYTLVADDNANPRDATTRLTTHIDRGDLSASRSALFAPETVAKDQPPESARVPVGSLADFDEWLREQSKRDTTS